MAAEDEVLLDYVKKHEEGNWNAVQKIIGLYRCGKSCRLRWSNHLRPNLKKGSFLAEEELLILCLYSQLGNKWVRMAAHLPGRTVNEITNYWNTRLKRRQRAGFPIYPPGIHCQHHASLSPTNTPPLTPTLIDNKSHHYPPNAFILYEPYGHNSPHGAKSVCGKAGSAEAVYASSDQVVTDDGTIMYEVYIGADRVLGGGIQ